MSNKILTAVWGASRQTGPRLLIMLSLADQANDNGECWPSYESIAQRARMSRRQAIRLMLQMSTEPRPEVTIQKRRRGKVNSSNVFTVHVDNLGGSDTAMSPPSDKAVSLGVVTQLRHYPSDIAVSPEPKENPKGRTHIEARTRKVSGFSAVITESDDPRITAWLTTISPQITAGYVALIAGHVKPEHVDSWQATLKLWAEREWRVNIGAMFERYDTAVNGKRVRALNGHGANGHAPAGDDKLAEALRLNAAKREGR